MNDFRPVALTPVTMKCLEKLVLHSINSMVPETVDPLQFAYRPNRSVDDALALALYSILKHLDTSNTYARLLFLDYSSVFHTIRPMKLTGKLADLGVPTPTRNWILDFLIDTPQVVRMGNAVSAELTVSTGTLQGCCLSPKLFSLGEMLGLKRTQHQLYGSGLDIKKACKICRQLVPTETENTKSLYHHLKRYHHSENTITLTS